MRVVIPWLAVLAMNPRFRGPEINASFDLQEQKAIELRSMKTAENLDFYVILPNETAHLNGSLAESGAGSIECRKMIAGDGVALWHAMLSVSGSEPDRQVTISLAQTADEAIVSEGRISVRF